VLLLLLLLLLLAWKRIVFACRSNAAGWACQWKEMAWGCSVEACSTRKAARPWRSTPTA
jgi:hypothetical protein